LKAVLEHSPAASNYTKVLEAGRGITVYRNAKALPKYRFAQTVRCVQGFAEAERIIRGPTGFDPAELTLVECGAELAGTEDLRTGSVLATEREDADTWIGEVSTEGRAFLVRSESAYPGWNARVDGERVPVLKVNGVVQGIVIPNAGLHKVEFAFQPRSHRVGLLVALTGLFAACIVLAVKRRRQASAQPRT
jgi:hypothetical protein